MVVQQELHETVHFFVREFFYSIFETEAQSTTPVMAINYCLHFIWYLIRLKDFWNFFLSVNDAPVRYSYQDIKGTGAKAKLNLSEESLMPDFFAVLMQEVSEQFRLSSHLMNRGCHALFLTIPLPTPLTETIDFNPRSNALAFDQNEPPPMQSQMVNLCDLPI
jgi:hypothetical protein